MFTEQVLPLVEREFPLSEPVFSRTWRTSGIGESYLEERLEGPLRPFTNGGLDLGFCAKIGEVEVRLAGRGARGAAQIADAASVIEAQVGESIFGEGEETLEHALVTRLSQRGETLALAESCTGGLIANRITNVPGASQVFLAGYITYANEAKIRMLGVPAEAIREHGAVSESVARAMAEGARRDSGATYALAVTGIAGPGGGTEEKPVGTVFMALATPEQTVVRRHLNALERETFKFLTAQQAMMLLWRELRTRPLLVP